MKILTLSIKQKYFDEILSGKKTVETREIRPTNAKKYIKYECNGKEYDADEDLPEEGDIDVKRKGAKVFFLTDENDNDITYEYKGETYIASQIEYNLGKVLEKSL